MLIQADERREVDKVFSGDIAAVVGLRDVTTGDTLCLERHRFFWNLRLSRAGYQHGCGAENESGPRKALPLCRNFPMKIRPSVVYK